jgi:hypothetical protein
MLAAAAVGRKTPQQRLEELEELGAVAQGLEVAEQILMVLLAPLIQAVAAVVVLAMIRIKVEMAAPASSSSNTKPQYQPRSLRLNLLPNGSLLLALLVLTTSLLRGVVEVVAPTL